MHVAIHGFVWNRHFPETGSSFKWPQDSHCDRWEAFLYS